MNNSNNSNRPWYFWFILIIIFAMAMWVLFGLAGPAAHASPTITILEPSPSETVSGTVQIKYRCTDPAGIIGIEVNAGEYGQHHLYFGSDPPTDYTGEFNWDTTQEKNGLTEIEVTFYNSNSEMNCSAIGVIVNNVKGPSVAWQKPSADQQFLSSVETTQIQASVSKGEGSAINRVRLWCDSTFLKTWTYSPAVNSATCTHTLDLTSLAKGKHTLKLEARNTDGGLTTSTRDVYRVDQYVRRYLAEGSTDWDYSCYISVENPNTTGVTVKLTYQTKNGPVAGPQFAMPAKSQATINPRDTVGNTDFSTKVECLEGKPIAADRTMTWVGPGAPCEEAHNSVGVTAPAKTWYLPEGSSDWGFETWTLVQNPNSSTANVTLTYMIENRGPVPVQVQVPPNSRGTWSMDSHIGPADSSIMVTSDQPVIAERAMYRNARREGHDSVGTTTAAADYFLAEGCVSFGFTTYVLVQNPQNNAVNVDITYMTGAGPVNYPTFQMAPGTRQTIKVNDTITLPDPNFSTRVHGSSPIIAERAMYWNGGPDGAEACHDSIGMDSAHMNFYLPDGETSDGRETWTLVQNPNSQAVTVEVSYLTPNGQGNVTKTETIPANSRRTWNMVYHSSIYGRAAIMVKCLTNGKPIMVERAMYWDSRGAGTDTIGGYSD